MRVIATRAGFYKGNLIEKDQQFFFEGKKLGSWMVPVEDAKAAAENGDEEIEKSPDTLSAMAKQNQKTDSKTDKKAGVSAEDEQGKSK